MKIRTSTYTNNQKIWEFLLNVNKEASVLLFAKTISNKKDVSLEYQEHGLDVIRTKPSVIDRYNEDDFHP